MGSCCGFCTTAFSSFVAIPSLPSLSSIGYCRQPHLALLISGYYVVKAQRICRSIHMMNWLLGRHLSAQSCKKLMYDWVPLLSCRFTHFLACVMHRAIFFGARI
jgi:hypothetical protein